MEESPGSTDRADGRHTFHATLLLVFDDVLIAITVLESEVGAEGEDTLVHVDDLFDSSGSVSDLLLHGVEVLVDPCPVGRGEYGFLDDHFSSDAERLVEPLKLIVGKLNTFELTVEGGCALLKTHARHLHKRVLIG
jgi:hypothetical protein